MYCSSLDLKIGKTLAIFNLSGKIPCFGLNISTICLSQIFEVVSQVLKE